MKRMIGEKERFRNDVETGAARRGQGLYESVRGFRGTWPRLTSLGLRETVEVHVYYCILVQM